MSKSFKKFVDTIPGVFNPEQNKVLKAVITALANSDDEIARQILAAKDQIFVKTAEGIYLELIGNSLGVSKPSSLGLTDDKFRELIPNLSLKPKQIKKAFYDTADVFWGPLFSRANVSSTNFGPFDISEGDKFTFKIDGKDPQTVKVLAGDIATDGAATSDELVSILNRIDGLTAVVLRDSISGNNRVNVRTDTPGSVGSIEPIESTGLSSSKLDLNLAKVDILDLKQRVSIYNVNPNELIIELPATVPALSRGRRGAHHFHEDSTLEPARGTSQTKWQGSFLFNPSSSGGAYTITSQRANLTQLLEKNKVYTSITVDDASSFEATEGFLIFNFGKDEEVPVAFRGVPNSTQIEIDPSHVFQKEHVIGSKVNVITQRSGYVPENTAKDFPVFLTSSSDAIETIKTILERLAAAGIVINFKILAPEYEYLIDNPYLTDDDAPSC